MTLCLPAQIGADEAVARFRRPRLSNLYGLLAPSIAVADARDRATRVPPFVERLWMPAYAIRFRTVQGDKVRAVWTSVDAWSGQFSLFDGAERMADRELREEAFPPNIAEDDAVERAQKGLLQFIMRQRGQFNKPVVEAVEEVWLYHFPLWVCYRKRGKRLDLRVLDACTGSMTGPKTRVALLDAFVAGRKAREASRAR